MRLVTGSGRGCAARATLGAAIKVGLWAASLWFAAAPAWAAEASKEPPATIGGFRPMPRAGETGAAAAAASNPATVSVAANASKTANVAGRYAILRAGGKDTGCMVTLDDKSRGPHGAFKAVLAPGCSDQGILIFDPVGWELLNGRLALVARKGHQTHLDQQPDGTWTKDPKEGQPLGLKKM